MTREGVVGHLIEDLYFWSQQLSEHALFLSLGLVKGDYGKRARQFHEGWEVFRARQLHAVPRIEELPGLVVQFKLEARHFADFQHEVHAELVAGKWLGWLYPGYIDHITRELDYAVAALERQIANVSRGTRAAREELCVWIPFLKEHAATISHLLDPKELPLYKDLDTFREKFSTLEGKCHTDEIASLLGMSRELGAMFDRFMLTSGIGTASVKSVVHPLLMEHVHREHERFLETIRDVEAGRVV